MQPTLSFAASLTMSTATPPKKPRRPRTPKNRFALPVRAADAVPVPRFAPVPRLRNRHDGWTPERQIAFIGALADTGCVDRAARMVNMAQTNCYTLRRAAGAEEFRAAWDAALDFGLGRLKDIAFQRAVEGELIPVFAGGKHMGFRRKRNDALLMFCLRHYGKDGHGKRTTINYFSSRASAGAQGSGSGPGNGPNGGPIGGGAGAEASTTTVRTVISGAGEAGGGRAQGEAAAARLEAFAGVTLDAEAQAAIAAALRDCAARAQAAEAGLAAGGDEAADWLADDPAEAFVPLAENGSPWRGELLSPVAWEEAPEHPGEDAWERLGSEGVDWVPVGADGRPRDPGDGGA